MYQTHTDLGIHKKFKKRFKRIKRKYKKVVKKLPLTAFTAGIKVPKTIIKTAIKLNKRIIKTAIKIPVKIISKGSKSIFKIPILLTGATGVGIAAKALRGKPRKNVRTKTGITTDQQKKIDSIVAERVAESLSKKQKIAPTAVVAPKPISRGSQQFTPAIVYSPGKPPTYINDEGAPTNKSGGMTTAVKVGAVVGAAAVGYLAIKG